MTNPTFDESVIPDIGALVNPFETTPSKFRARMGTVISYGTRRNITASQRNPATSSSVTVDFPHGYQVGDTVFLVNTTTAALDGTATIVAITDAFTFTISTLGTSVTGSAGRVFNRTREHVVCTLGGATAKADGSNTVPVRYFGPPPPAGSQVWIGTDGLDLFALGALASLGASAPACVVSKSATTAANTAVATDVPYETEVTDPWDMHAASAAEVYVPVGGLYKIDAGATFASDQTGSYRLIQILINGTATVRNAYPATPVLAMSMQATTTEHLQAGDVIKVQVQGNYTPASINIAASLGRLSVTFLSP